ncbi:DUF488 domain-containing protein [Billgrantia gudaonensis]|uniref:DUF488 domain-containing protein n=1 Tax=Billgrantia gudaonensis TaxID=376427 RepID=A0A432JIE2_9GAMM|nr:DUF488 domain-containing protein [Halomonas gudaonensis]
MALFTAGYEGIDIDTFLKRLRDAGVDKVIDVRQYPISRKPGFSKTAFSSRLRAAGIDYEHIRELGCPSRFANSTRRTVTGLAIRAASALT